MADLLGFRLFHQRTCGKTIGSHNNKMVDEFTKVTAQAAQMEAYASTTENVLSCWKMLGMIIIVFVAAAIISLEFVDHDKR